MFILKQKHCENVNEVWNSIVGRRQRKSFSSHESRNSIHFWPINPPFEVEVLHAPRSADLLSKFLLAHGRASLYFDGFILDRRGNVHLSKKTMHWCNITNVVFVDARYCSRVQVDVVIIALPATSFSAPPISLRCWHLFLLCGISVHEFTLSRPWNLSSVFTSSPSQSDGCRSLFESRICSLNYPIPLSLSCITFKCGKLAYDLHSRNLSDLTRFLYTRICINLTSLLWL